MFSMLMFGEAFAKSCGARNLRKSIILPFAIGLALRPAACQTPAMAGDPVACCSQARALMQSLPKLKANSHDPVVLEPGRKQLFIDSSALQKVENVDLKLHQPKKFGAVIRPDQPWESHAIQIRSAPVWSVEEKIWKIWYIGGRSCIALSHDGIHWTKPALGKFQYQGSKENNIVTPASDNRMNVVYDPDDPDPGRRYKALAADPKGRRPAVSGDGVDWKVLDTPPILSSDESSLYYDRENRLFIATVKHAGPYGRSVYLSLSRDFEHWTDPRDSLIFYADQQDQELGTQRILARFANSALQAPELNVPEQYNVDVYNMAVVRYEGMYLGLPAMFHQTGKVPKEWPGFARYKLSEEIDKAVHLYGDWTGFHQLELLSSRNLIHWEHTGQREPFLDNSPVGSGAYDLQVVLPSPPVVRDNELWFYYTGIRQYAYISSDMPDAGAICLAKLRLDGFVSLSAGSEPGNVVTKPFVLAGKNLHLNLDAPAGDIRVEVLDDATKQVLAGYSLQNSLAVTGDRLDAEVRWNKAKISSLIGRKVCFRFTLQNAHLYAFWVI